MKNEPGRIPSKRWQDIRALAIDATFDADRRRTNVVVDQARSRWVANHAVIRLNPSHNLDCAATYIGD